jgi:hypothetical protein
VNSPEGKVIEVTSFIFGPKFSWLGFSMTDPVASESGARFTKTAKTPATVTWMEEVSVKGKDLSWTVRASSDRDLSLTYAALGFSLGEAMRGGTAEVTMADGATRIFDIPLGKADLKQVKQVVFRKEGTVAMTLSVTPALDVHLDGGFRFKVAGESLAASEPKEVRFVLSGKEALTFYASPEDLPDPVDTSKWFSFTPTNSSERGALGMQEWMEIPKTFLQLDGDRVLADGKPFKVWGTNVEYSATNPDARRAERLAGWFAKWGVNVVRQHKLTNPGWEGLGSRQSASVYDPDALARFDYFNYQLREHGVLYGFSPIWNLKLFPGDKEKLIAYDELMGPGGDKDTTGLVWFMKDVQDLHIETMLNLLNHRNPHSGLRYAEDPALAFVEIQNEEDVFWFTITPDITRYPTYRRLIAEQFSNWLQKRYETEENLVAAWGAEGLNTFSTEGGYPDESLTARNIMPISTPWLLDHHMGNHPRAARLRDTADFLLESQNNYYQRMTDVIREAGYQGPIIGSNWQAGERTGHFYNLYSDAKVGIVDRHNYLAGATGNPVHEMHTGHPFRNATTLDDPGGALLSSGMQQVANRPFSLSEWQAIPPQEWIAAETAIIALYGMGLQGWDMSYFFASNGEGFTPTLQFPGNKKFNNQTAHGIGMFPLLGRMILRGDITEGAVVARRTLTLEQARNQTYDFEHKTVQAHDLKSFDGTPGRSALAIGRVVVDFVDRPTPSELTSLDPYKQGDTLISTTGQLRWTDPGGTQAGYITVNSPGTQGVLGFAPKDAWELGDLTVEPQNDFSVVMATAMEPDRTLADCDEALVLALARVRNTGMKLVSGVIADRGTAPTIVEPVKTMLTFKRQPREVIVLDQDGMLTETRLPLNGNKVTIDTGIHRSFYYLVRF